jgi:hypothetical protein
MYEIYKRERKTSSSSIFVELQLIIQCKEEEWAVGCSSHLA